MRVLKHVALLSLLATVLLCCKKERSFEDPTHVPGGAFQWAFKQGSHSFGGPMDTADIQKIGVANSLSLTGTSTDGKSEIALQLLSNGEFTKGEYQSPQVIFQFLQNGSATYQSAASDGFTITITAIDSISVSGTFSGVVTDFAGNTQSITEGKFTAALRHHEPAPDDQKGFLTVWSKQLCGGGGSIEVKIGDSTEMITQAMSVQPTCQAPGAANFVLSPGTYTVKAICGTDTVSYQVGVLPNACGNLQVDLSQPPVGDYFPYVSWWTYGNDNNYDDDTLKISNVGEQTFETQTGSFVFQKFFNDRTGETKYYRKEAGVYYQYIDSASALPLVKPVEIPILLEDTPENGTWHSVSYDIDYSSSGISNSIVTARLESTVTRKDFALTIGSQTFNHCIEVSTDLWLQDGTDWSPGDSGFITVFAKGFGIVSYQDLNTGDTWLIRHYEVSF